MQHVATSSPNLKRVTVSTSRPWGWWLGAFALMVVISGTQLYLQTRHGGQPVSYLRIFTANLVAMAPWIPLGLGIVWLVDHPPFDGWRGVVWRVAESLVVPSVFLAWLAFFHWWISPAEASTSPIERYGYWLRSDFAEFFTWAVLIHWLFVAAATATQETRVAKSEATNRTRDEVPKTPASDTLTTNDGPPPSPPLVIRSLGRTRVIDPATVEWIEADGSYVKLHTRDRCHLLRRTIKDLEHELGPRGFARIHRSTLVRVERIAEFLPRSHGDATVVLRGGQALRVSRTYRRTLQAFGL